MPVSRLTDSSLMLQQLQVHEAAVQYACAISGSLPVPSVLFHQALQVRWASTLGLAASAG